MDVISTLGLLFATEGGVTPGEGLGWCHVRQEENVRSPRLSAVEVARRVTDPRKGVVVVDEADDLLGSRREEHYQRQVPRKGQLNQILESSTAQMIWITNSLFLVDESVLRRFTYTLYLRRLSAARRTGIWEHHLRSSRWHDRVSDTTLHSLAGHYEANAGHIVSAVRDALNPDTIPEERAVDCVREVLRSHLYLRDGRYPEAESRDHEYDPGSMNADVPVTQVVASLSRAPAGGSRTVLFWGRPGTGRPPWPGTWPASWGEGS